MTACADAVVFATWGGRRWLLLVERGDGLGWALPGGKVERHDESVAHAAQRELVEETGLRLPLHAFDPLPSLHVPDDRFPGGWVQTTPSVADLGVVPHLPTVEGMDGCGQAAWLSAGSYNELLAGLRQRFAGEVFWPHRWMLLDLVTEHA